MSARVTTATVKRRTLTGSIERQLADLTVLVLSMTQGRPPGVVHEERVKAWLEEHLEREGSAFELGGD